MPLKKNLRSIWVSDVHLGSRACRADLLLNFLHNARCEILYLVGDIIDLESMKRTVYWPSSHTEVLQLILEKSRAGTRVVYIPGNHDDELRTLCGRSFGNIEVARRLVHTTKTGRRLLVLHGDEFDGVITCGALATAIGGAACRSLLTLNRFVHWVHDLFGKPYWSLAQHVKQRFSHAVRYVEKFQSACLTAAAEAGVDGVICGHVHRADLLERDGLVYCNDGDWVESCTALVEDQHGELSLLSWRETREVPADAWEIRDAA